MPKEVKTEIFVCTNCGNEYGKWSGTCPGCGEWNSLKAFGAKKIKSNKVVARHGKIESIKLSEISKGSDLQTRLKTGISELERVLGGGLVKGGVVLFAGEPGIGKSTLLTQLIAKTGGLYVGGEESAEQIGMRVSRLGLSKEAIEVLEETDVDEIVGFLDGVQNVFSLVVVDSIQVLSSAEMSGGAGSPGQIKESCLRLIEVAKRKGMSMVIVGHVTKEGDIAGPKMLEHMVDVVLYLEGDKTSDFRILRCYKNRFGPTDEVGVFRMKNLGLEEVRSEELSFTESNQSTPGSALTIVMDGSRPMLVEIQALVVESFAPQPRRVFSGIAYDRGQLMVAVAQKILSIPLYKYDVFLQVTGGIKINDPSADLAIVAAIYSSYKNKPIKSSEEKKQIVLIGEVSLLGKVKFPRNMEKREKEARVLGKTVVKIQQIGLLR